MVFTACGGGGNEPQPQPACWTAPTSTTDWPPACWRPYQADSTFNKGIAANPTLLPNSAAIVHRVLGDIHDPAWQKPNNMVANQPTGNTGEPTYYSHPSDPVFTLHCKNDPFGRPDGACPLENVQLHIPAGAQIEGGSALVNNPLADRHLTVLDMAAGWEYDLWQVKTTPLPAGGGPLELSWGGRTRVFGDGLAERPAGGQPAGDATAAHIGSLAGRIRVEELEAGQINHALFIDINCDSGGIVYPAAGHGRACSALGKSTVDAPPMGARFQLNVPASDIDQSGFPDWKKTILRAARTYGMILGDTGAQGYFSIETEAGNQYTSVGAQDKWLAFAKANGWTYYAPDQNWVGDLNGHLPNGSDIWSNLRVVAPILPATVQVPRSDPTPPTVVMDVFTDTPNVSQPIATVSDGTGPVVLTMAGNETVTLVAAGRDGDGGTQDIQIWMTLTTFTTDPLTGLQIKQGPGLAGRPSASNPDSLHAPGDSVSTDRITPLNLDIPQLRAGHSAIEVVTWGVAVNFSGGTTTSPQLTLRWP